MDYYSNDQLYKYFEAEIRQNASKQMEALQKQIADNKAREINKVKEDLQESIDRKLKADLKELDTDHSYEVNRITQDNSRKLMKRRQELLEDVFSKTEAKLVEFTKTDAYGALMKAKIDALADRFSGCTTRFGIRKDDSICEKAIKANFHHDLKIETDPAIEIGGFSLLCEKMGIEIDETMDTRLSDQKEWFYENSNLYVK